MIFITMIKKIVNNEEYDFEFALVGNPNVGKSTIFNSLTRSNQHTGNWSGKTVEYTSGYYENEDKIFKVIDLPGTYSLFANSEEEFIASGYISNSENILVFIIDSTNILRNLNLLLQVLNVTTNVLVCLNFEDELKKKGIYIDVDELSLQLGVPVLSLCAKKNRGIKLLKDTVSKLYTGSIKTYKVKNLIIQKTNDYEMYSKSIYSKCKEIYDKCVITNGTKCEVSKIDRLFTNKYTGLPVTFLMLGVIFWITIVGANYVSDFLFGIFSNIKVYLLSFLKYFHVNNTIISFIMDGVYTTLTWVVSVMLPPIAIFFPLYSLLEESGMFPRIAFNFDRVFHKFGTQGKQALTMAVGFGCNCCGVTGCRIIDSERDKNIAVVTNSFIPCNGKLPTIISIISIFFTTTSLYFMNTIFITLIMMLIILFSVMITLHISLILSKTVYKGMTSSFVLELPPFRKPQVIKTLIYSVKTKVLSVLSRAVLVAIPSGAVIWIFANTSIYDKSLLFYISEFLNPFGVLLGLDGVIILSFILGFAANETVVPIAVMTYMSNTVLIEFTNTQLYSLISNNGWTITTAMCFIVLCLFHFPCSTTCLTIYKETKSVKTTFLSIILPTIVGLGLCLIINNLSLIISSL